MYVYKCSGCYVLHWHIISKFFNELLNIIHPGHQIVVNLFDNFIYACSLWRIESKTYTFPMYKNKVFSVLFSKFEQ